MVRFVYFLAVLFTFLTGKEALGQGTFQLPEGEKRLKIKAGVVNNLVIIPITVNGVELSFLLDTGVRSTILFGIDSDEDLKLNNKSTVWLTGAGDGEPTEAIKSTHNIISVGESTAIDQIVYYIPDGETNFSPRLGFAVHGIIGYELFKDFVVEVDYQREYVKLHDPDYFKSSRYGSDSAVALDMIGGKPYIDLKILGENDAAIASKLLLDSGSGDALWLFENEEKGIQVSENSFKDHLGLGLSGEVTGYRARLPRLELGSYTLNEVNVAYPDTTSLNYLRGVNFRNGSLGSEILKRFKVVLDYQNELMYLRKNRYFDEPFRYDRSGLVVQHTGFELVAHLDYRISKEQNMTEASKGAWSSGGSRSSIFLETNMVQFPQFKLKPNYEIAAIREDSPGAEAGLSVGDKLIKVNGRAVANLKLEEITRYFYRNEGSVLKLQVDRNGMVFNCKIRLRKMLD
ncbi:pepsin/retropepsin-like aspartic protease family protein [Leeuwenhoekiella nanhaiensis]|uniref:PDZ domain-containing protein n=1 Tax=Leeuwenhoekiella nanhaiensis TaxID=1655491 RepID=A0A2G1VWY5_9FLAO|nr:aspartyl protease family protein [Leeuwenhoekiella nanhaiensis]PHQ31286.1 hypothetical protein CJ305_03470 [Leeuwenhoekiella nanhaiensis]